MYAIPKGIVFLLEKLRRKVVRNYKIPTLTIAGSDSSGGAGIQADLKTFSAIGTYGMSVITAITAQNTEGVFDVEELSSKIIKEQIKAVCEDIMPNSIKIGMVSSPEIILDIAESLKKYPFLKVNPSDPTMQKVTPAGKQYKDLTQTYINLIKVLISATEKDGGQEDSPLREYMRKLNKNG